MEYKTIHSLDETMEGKTRRTGSGKCENQIEAMKNKLCVCLLSWNTERAHSGKPKKSEMKKNKLLKWIKWWKAEGFARVWESEHQTNSSAAVAWNKNEKLPIDWWRLND